MFWQKKTVIAGCPVMVLLLFVFGWYHDLFHTTAYYDIFMHGLGGGLFITTLAGLGWHLWWKQKSGRLPGAVAFKSGLIAGLLLTSISWEIFEVAFNLTPNWTLSVADTLSDMLYALIGAAIMLCFIRIP